MARAVRHITLGMKLGNETLSLKIAALDLVRMVETLQGSSEETQCTCQRCHKPKKPLELSVHDAAQCYEELDAETNHAYLMHVMLMAEFKGFFSVAVPKKKNAHCWMANGRWPGTANTDTFSFAELRDAMRVGLNRRTTQLGPAGSVVQFTPKRGVPIGGLRSAASATTVLGGAEAGWSAHHEMRAASGFDGGTS